MATGWLKNYSSKMYESSAPECLRTGDVVCLASADFKEFVKHSPMLAVLKQFEENESYAPKFWAVLNKPCDMVHGGGRVFKSNLFLAPLLGFKLALKRELFGDGLLSLKQVPKSKDVLIEAYRVHMLSAVEKEHPKGDQEKRAAHRLRIDAFVAPAVAKLREIIESSDEESESPEQLLRDLIEFTKEEPNISSSLAGFASDRGWLSALKKYDETKVAAQVQDGKIVLKASAAKGPLADLCLNQMDSKGIFFFEPHSDLSSKGTDLAFIIELQNMLTLKIKQSALDDGALFKMLMDKRRVSLTENFSDRLLNIMGNYFSKIGTDDVMVDEVIRAYKEQFPNEFFSTVQEFETAQGVVTTIR